MSETYAEFLARKQVVVAPSGFKADAINANLFGFQRDVSSWACRRGRAAIFADCGTGKTMMQLDIATHAAGETGKPTLILAPLAVAHQTAREADKFGFRAVVCPTMPEEIHTPIVITNYQRLHHFNPDAFGAVCLDESSILKSFDGKFRNGIIEAFGRHAYRFAFTATPAPNDFVELGNHSEFLGIMSRVEMLATFFNHDGGSTSDWRLKGHAEDDFWKWVCSWAVIIRKPSDIGHSDEGWILPELRIHKVILPATVDDAHATGKLFVDEASTLTERRDARKQSIPTRVAEVARLVALDDSPAVVWCNLNDEGKALTAAIPGAVEVAGVDEDEEKEERMLGFASGAILSLVTKPSIAGFGMNWQHCHRVFLAGLSDSYEQLYQVIRRCWRFGQKHPVDVWIIIDERETAVLDNIQRKERQAAEMMEGMLRHMGAIQQEQIRGAARETTRYETETKSGEKWTAHLGDSCEVIRAVPDDSVHYSIFSPPFASLYTYSASDRDMGNCRDAEEFFDHFRVLIPELLRVTMPGRLLSFHCMNMPTSKARDGVIGLRDFRGDLIRAFTDCGWIFHSEVCIWKDPVTAMQRTKAIGLLYKQLRKDSSISRQGIPDYLVTMRKPGANPEPVEKTHDGFPVGLWQRYASPVWMDINPSDTLQFRNAREDKDERHICPLQLEVIRRGIELWTNPGDVVFSPFGGIGSEGHEAIRAGRRSLSIELKRSYFDCAVRNLAAAEAAIGEEDLFGTPGAVEELQRVENQAAENRAGHIAGLKEELAELESET